jgi:isocitrate dehydrogenase
VRVVRVADGTTLLEHDVDTGDIWRMCQTKDAAIRDWVGLAVERARVSGMPVIFWLDESRAHDAELLGKVHPALDQEDTEGLTIDIADVATAARRTLERARAGEDTIAATGNVLRDYLTDLFPILELGTSAKMLSVVPLLAGGGLFETGAGGSAPRHVDQLLKENHLRWDSLGEFLALVPSLELLATKTDNPRAKVLADTLDRATGRVLEDDRSPKRQVGEIDSRGSHFYLGLFWARELADQSEDGELAERFRPLAERLESEAERIVQELSEVQGRSVDIGGYYHPDIERMTEVMRPSETLNATLEGFDIEPVTSGDM